jgi:cold shock protein
LTTGQASRNISPAAPEAIRRLVELGLKKGK